VVADPVRAAGNADIRHDRRMTDELANLRRRAFLGRGASLFGVLGVGFFGGIVSAPLGCAGSADLGELLPADSNGLMLLPGFSSRIVARTGEKVGATDHVWHAAPDGGATFATGDGGWVYVSNSELPGGAGGVGAIRFDAAGGIVDAYPILTGTHRNCAGGPTPWGTWLSCEEVDAGRVFECDPFTKGSEGVERPAFGLFCHEAAAVDPLAETIYLTEDREDGLLYRFTPAAYPDLSTGILEATTIVGTTPIVPGEMRELAWSPVPDPSAALEETRAQVPGATPFNGGEGCWYEAGTVFFTTKGDERVWKITTATQRIEIVYDRRTSPTPTLRNPDNVVVASDGTAYVAEDPGYLKIVALTPSGEVKPILKVTWQWGSEITGPAFSPDGTRLYFSSQRRPGTTYEVTGPFLAPEPAAAQPGPVARSLLAGAIARRLGVG